jgi:GTP-binding nuclear protein Ran
MTSYKVAVIGEHSTGKTTWMQRLITGEFTVVYNPTFSGQTFVWNCRIRSDMTRRAKDSTFVCVEGTGLDVIDASVQAVIIFYDCTSTESFSDVDRQIDAVKVTHPQLPIIVCANKYDVIDVKYIKCRSDAILWTISAKSNRNIENPFRSVMRAVSGDPSLRFVPTKAVAPPEVEVTPFILTRSGGRV